MEVFGKVILLKQILKRKNMAVIVTNAAQDIEYDQTLIVQGIGETAAAQVGDKLKVGDVVEIKKWCNTSWAKEVKVEQGGHYKEHLVTIELDDIAIKIN